ncbi:unnamed protein product [Agarophyton chilense]
MVLVITFFLLTYSASAGIIEDFQEPDCSNYDPEKRLEEAGENGNCLSALQDPLFRMEFDKCKNNTCFLITQEPPIINLNQEFFHAEENRHRMQLPFICRNPRQVHRSLRGFGFEILKATSAGDDYCVWAGPLSSCTWNSLVHFAAMMGKNEGYQFAVFGPMYETPQRKCYHFASASWWDDQMIILGRNVRENKTDTHPIWQLIKPFESQTWIVVGSMITLFFFVCLLIVYRFRAFHRKSLVTAISAYFLFMGHRDGAVATSRFAEEENFRQPSALKKDGSIGRESSSSLQSAFSTEDFSQQIETTAPELGKHILEKEAFLTKFSLSTSLFRISIVAFIAMFSLFYEVAVVNFLFQQQNLELTKDIEHLTLKELHQYCVVRDTAAEAIWNFRVNPGGSKFDDAEKSQIPWKRCQNGAECLSWILDDDNPVQFYITYELEGTHLIKSRASCESVTIFETKRSIHHFNSGWLFNEQVPTEKRRKLDRELMALKIDGTLSDLVGDRAEVCDAIFMSSITYAIILLPVAFLVFPPLLCSAIVAICSRKISSVRNRPHVTAA